MKAEHDIHSSLVGNWSLLSYSARNLDGQLVTLRERQIGRLIYSADGRVSLHIERDPAVLQEYRLDPRTSRITYAGRFEVDENSLEVRHVIESCNITERIGSILSRSFRLQDDRLFIEGNGLCGHVCLEWKRLGDLKSTDGLSSRHHYQVYSPQKYISADDKIIKDLILKNEFATLISNGIEGLQISYLPLMLEEHEGKILLLGHMAKANPHWWILSVASKCTVIFRGPDHYVSPSWYVPRNSNVPTWNYATVQVEGTVELIADEQRSFKVLERQVQWWESSVNSDWRLPADSEAIQQLSKNIVAFQIRPEIIEAKVKLSQGQNEEDRNRVIENLLDIGTDKARFLAELMRAKT